MPLTDHVALVSLTSDVPTRSFLQAAAAIQKQITRDFTPIWGLPATVDAFEDLASVPSDYHPVVLFGDPKEVEERLQFAVGWEYAEDLIDDFEKDRLSGLHLNAFTRQPFALVEASDTWSVTLSHEVLEMITDPFGNRLIAAAHPLDRAQRVKYLLEVCDPCQTVWYPVNGVPVADFFTPRYFDPVRVDRSRYSFTGALEYPSRSWRVATSPGSTPRIPVSTSWRRVTPGLSGLPISRSSHGAPHLCAPSWTPTGGRRK